jgi:hypothetical protein
MMTQITALGASDQLPIRAAQVSAVIWVIIGVGFALLAGAAGLRLAHRVRRGRALPPPDPDPEQPPDPDHEQHPNHESEADTRA